MNHPARNTDAARWARLATQALLTEAELTPKPALVDQRGQGAHRDLTLAIMRRSALAIQPFFEEMALVSAGREPSRFLREQLAAIGRRAERAMLKATGGSNAHRGAIWTLGLLTASAAMGADSREIASMAGAIAALPDRPRPVPVSHGYLAELKYGVTGAKGEAQSGFPHVLNVGLPMLRRRRDSGVCEDHARLDALLSIMSTLDDTCLLHRGGMDALAAAKRGARRVLELGGVSSTAGMRALLALDAELVRRNASPGGSADLLAATLFLDAADA